jgi:hypothetical protein
MDEAKKVADRLERIDGLRRAGAAPARLLADVRALLAEGEAWLAAERLAAASSSDPPTREKLDALREQSQARPSLAGEEAVAKTHV